MSGKTKEICTIVSQECIGRDIYSLWLQTDKIAENAKPGQFVSLYTGNESKLLPRPISLCEIDREKGRIRLVYRVTGKNTGTEKFSHLHKKVGISTLGPLGNGFPMEAVEGKKVFLMGGGIGIPPMLETAKQLNAEKSIILGYRDETFLTEEFEKYGKVYIASEDGKTGTKGNVMDAVRENNLTADAIFACGPAPMLRAIKAYALEQNIPCWISMEERMACGIGACLACVCQSKDVDEHSHVHNKRVCKDGPVFLSTEVEL
ncbi:MAG: dihydroorotate dehydrogenase electron transfer subunit [Clostridia bacterium]|nr:dihydroorotate dehydrogenase electron transfer subunit [Clostridia bacterium]MDY5554427.1 dihydroorotate dehydrogenase electron transfer subunit [Blautia sp.]